MPLVMRGPNRLAGLGLTSGDTTWLGGAWKGAAVVGNAGTSVTLNFAGAPVGEWLFAVIGLSDSQAQIPTPPAGWDVVKQGGESASGAASSLLMVYRRLKHPGDTTQLFTWGTSCNFAAQPISWLGLDQVTPIESATYLAHTSGQTFATASLTPTGTDRRVAAVFLERGSTTSGTFDPPPGMTERADIGSASNPWCLLQVAETVGRVPASAQTFTAFCSATASHGGAIAFALIPAGSGPLIYSIPAPRRHPGAGPGMRLVATVGDTTILATPGGQADSGVSEADQHTATAASGVKGGAGVGRSTARASTSCTGIKGSTGVAAAVAHPATADAGSKAATGVGAAIQRSATSAAKATVTTGTGNTYQRSSTSAAGVHGGTSAGKATAHPATGSVGRHQSAGTALAAGHTATRVVGAHAATGPGRAYTHITTSVVGLQVAAFVPAYVGIDGSATGTSYDSTASGSSLDGAASHTGDLDSNAIAGTYDNTTTAAGYM